MARKVSKKTLKRKCDILFGKIIRKQGNCEKCLRTDMKLEAAHIISRTYAKVRYDYNNALCLCSSCHRWAHANPWEFGTWVDKYVGRLIMKALNKEAKRTDYQVDYEAKFKELTKEWENINA